MLHFKKSFFCNFQENLICKLLNLYLDSYFKIDPHIRECLKITGIQNLVALVCVISSLILILIEWFNLFSYVGELSTISLKGEKGGERKLGTEIQYGSHSSHTRKWQWGFSKSGKKIVCMVNLWTCRTRTNNLSYLEVSPVVIFLYKTENPLHNVWLNTQTAYIH